MPSKTSDSPETPELSEIPTIHEESTSLGDIKINHTVIASIVKLAAKAVPGVVAVGGGFVDHVTGMFSKKDAGAGIRVEEDENSNYLIVIRVVMSFGVNLAKTADEIQTAVQEQILKMTNKQASKIDVIIDEVKMPDSESEEEAKDENWEES